jgi:FeS assembly SUF system protein
MSDEQVGETPAVTPPPDPEALREAVIEVLKTCYDPEIPVNIYELGLIYLVHVSDDGVVDIKMTLTSPMCPVAGSLPPEVESKVRGIAGVKEARVEVVWDPPWDMSKMSEAARLQLNLM